MKLRDALSLPLLAMTFCFVVSCASTDVGITTKVKANLLTDDTVKSSHIEVATKEGVVTLTGNVDNDAVKNRAIEIANGTKGVVRVIDMIATRQAGGTGDAPSGPDRSLGETVTDAGITLSVKERLLDDPLVKGLRIDVDTRDGVVYLTGSVTSDDEMKQAIQLTKDTKGVRDVQANLKIEKG